MALYFAAWQQAGAGAEYGELALQWISDALDRQNFDEPQFLAQQVWVMWAARQLDRQYEQSGNSRFCDDIDEMLLEHLLQTPLWTESFDLIHGLAAVGGYALALGHEGCGEAMFERVLQLLDGIACKQDGFQWWACTPENTTSSILQRAPHGYSDLGLAHGNAGIMVLLARAIQQGMHQALAGPMLEKLAAWMLAQQNAPGCASRFAYIAEEPGVVSRAAWCYGDVGIGWALVCAGQVMAREDWIESGVRAAHAVMLRVPGTLGFDDDALCHGRAGVGHILLRQARMVNDASLASFAHNLLEQALQALEAGNGIEGADASYLEGLAGVGLALMDAVFEPDMPWDYPLLLG